MNDNNKQWIICYDLIADSFNSYDVDASIISTGDVLDSYLADGFSLIDIKNQSKMTVQECREYIGSFIKIKDQFKELFAYRYMHDYYIVGIRK